MVRIPGSRIPSIKSDCLALPLPLKDECPVNALRTQNLPGGHFLGHEIRLVFVSLGILAILGIN